MFNLNYYEIGQRIKSRRKELNMTQPELAAKVNLATSSISRYENGKVEDATTAKFNEFAKALNVSPAHLLGWTENQLSSPGISRETDRITDNTTPEQLAQLQKYFEEQEKEPSLDNLTEIIKSLPTETYSEIKEYLLFMQFKHYGR